MVTLSAALAQTPVPTAAANGLHRPQQLKIDIEQTGVNQLVIIGREDAAALHIAVWQKKFLRRRVTGDNVTGRSAINIVNNIVWCW